MSMTTASSVISLARKLEQESAGFYEAAAQRYPQGRQVFLSFAKENARNISEIERAYYSVISDALEGCFAFEMDEGAWLLDTQLTGEEPYSEVVNRALQMERKLIDFYGKAAEQSKGLMADVPKAFNFVARKRNGRLAKLESLLNQ